MHKMFTTSDVYQISEFFRDNGHRQFITVLYGIKMDMMLPLIVLVFDSLIKKNLNKLQQV